MHRVTLTFILQSLLWLSSVLVLSFFTRFSLDQNCAGRVPSRSPQAPRQQKNVGSVCGKCLSHPAKVWQKEQRFIGLDLLEIINTIFDNQKMKKSLQD